MIETKLKSYIGELVFNNAILSHRVEELEEIIKNLKAEKPEETKSEG